jgi:hypothetical protein
MVQEFEQNPNKIRSGNYDIAIKSLRNSGDLSKKVEFEIKCDVRAVDGQEIEEVIFNIGSLGSLSGTTRNAMLIFRSATSPVHLEFDRMNAIKLAKYINSNGGNVKPTELPLS